MIDPKELRLFNRIMVGEREAVVVGIMPDMIETDIDAEVLPEMADYIPLTPEWLERFGLYKPHDQFYWTFNDKELCKLQVHFTEGKRSWYVYWNGAFIGYREHVHEFQNLVKELTGQELKTTE